jgi:CheY-like chemotaxis protein
MPVMDGYEFLGRLRTRFTPTPMKYIMEPFGK